MNVPPAPAFESMMGKSWAYVSLGVLLAFVAGYAVGRLGVEKTGPPRGGGQKAPPAPPARTRGRVARAGDAAGPGTPARRPVEAAGLPGRPLPAAPREGKAVPDAFAIRADCPVRISWPLDLAPGVAGRMCLRARQGANELQDLGDGWALYGLRIERPGHYRAFLKVKWLHDGVGDPDCNNSWFAGFGGKPTGWVGDDQPGPVWHWVPGPARHLLPGVHWFVVAVREDGTFLDRIAFVHVGVQLAPDGLEKLPLVSFTGLAGERPPISPHSPVRDVEVEAVPTRSLVIGAGHRNELTVLASFQGGEGSFDGMIGVGGPGLRVTGDRRIRCSADEPYARAVLGLEFGPGLSRGGQTVTLSVVDSSRKCVFRKRFTFLKPAAWAFLGPFPDASAGGAGALGWPTQARLDALAKRTEFAASGDERAEPEAGEEKTTEWKLVADGSCYDELGAVDLFEVYGPTTNAYCYAVSWLACSTNFNHRPVLFQSDDTAALWIDGGLVSVVPVRLAKQHSRLWSGSPFRRGLSPVVVKVAQTEGYWGFRLDALDWHAHGPRGERIRWAEPSQWPAEKKDEPHEPGADEPPRVVPEVELAE